MWANRSASEPRRRDVVYALLLICAALLACSQRKPHEPVAARHELATSGVAISDGFPLGEQVYRTNPNVYAFPSASNGSESLLLYYAGTPTYLIAVRLSSTGTALDPRGILLDVDPRQYSMDALWTGSHWLVLYEKYEPGGPYATYAITLSREGVPGTPRALGVSERDALAWGGDRALVAGHPSVFVDGNGVPLTQPFNVTTRSGYVFGHPAFHDGIWIVPSSSPSSRSDIVATSLLPDGSRVQSVTMGQHWGPVSADWNGSSFMISYAALPPDCQIDSCVRIRRCRTLVSSPEGALHVGDESACPGEVTDPRFPTSVLELPSTQQSPALAFDGRNYLATWNDGGLSGVVGLHLDALGARVESQPFMITSGAGQASLLAVSNGTNALVTSSFFDGSNMVVGSALVGADGSVTPQSIGPRIDAVASGGARYLVTWISPSNIPDPTEWPTRAALLEPNGELSPEVTLPKGATGTSAAFDGENYAVVWGESTSTGERRLSGVRITPELSVLDETPPELLTYSVGYGRVGPQLAAGDRGWLIAWIEGVTPDVMLRAAFLTSDLKRMSAPVTVGPGGVPDNATVRVAFDGSVFWVTWLEYRYNVAPRLLAARIDANGALIDSSPIVVTRAAPGGAALVAGANGQMLLVYSGSDYGAPLRGRFLKSLGTGGGGPGGSGGASAGGAGVGGAAGFAAAGSDGLHATGGAGTGTGGAGGSKGMSGDGGTACAGGSDDGGTVGSSGHGADGGETNGGSATGGRCGETGMGGTIGGSNTTGASGEGTAGDDGGGTSGTGTQPPADDDGCTCSTAPRTSDASGYWVSTLLVAALRARRRALRSMRRPS
jgi:hypothetical protein